MKLYVVYNTNVDGSQKWVDSYWLNYENAVARFKKIWLYCREPDEREIAHHVKTIKTEDYEELFR